MYRYLAMVVFVLPKLIVWPLMWHLRCKRKKINELNEELALQEGCPANMRLENK